MLMFAMQRDTMDENSGAPPESVNRASWENFEGENGKINNHICHDISSGVKEENLSDNSALISDPKALRQPGNSSLNGEKSLTGTDFKENLDEKSQHLEQNMHKVFLFTEWLQRQEKFTTVTEFERI